MVRKRSRKYESDDSDNDSDLDFELSPDQGPAPKKYSLRERRAPMLTTNDFYYGIDDDDADVKQSSDDDDFEVEADVESTRTYYEPEPEPEVQTPDGVDVDGGLIDFEDIIRADIVVNKNKIDYDNIIQKTEIKLTENRKKPGGRKPRKQPSEENETDPSEEAAPTHTCEPDIQALAYLEHQDEQESKEAAPENPEIDFCQQALPNGDVSIEQLLENGDSSKLANESDPLGMKNASNIEKDTSNPPLVTSPPENNLQEVEKNPGEESKGIEDDDDVIVLGEVKQPVIVLDD